MFLKRVFDLLFSLSLMILLFPLLFFIAAALLFKMGRPVLYRQIRPGLHGKPFVLYKFRTMNDLRDATGVLLPDERRIFPFGSFLRSFSLDELPELWNVLCGSMSLVGPRPLLTEYLPRYNAEQKRRHDVKPGITGWAQINGRNAISWEDKFRLDVWYVDHRNFRLDLKIIALTLLQVLKREGISAEGHATMPEFTGTREGMRRD